MKTVLTIAGSDSGGGAGIQADLKTFAAHAVHGASAITAITAQSTTTVAAIHPLPADLVVAQIEAVWDDLGVDAVKTGMLATASIVEAVADCLERHPRRRLVVDPVLATSGGTRLLDDAGVELLRSRLLPLAWCVTPNRAEAERLTGGSIASIADARRAAARLVELGAHTAIVTGGHLPTAEVVDVVHADGAITEVTGPRRRGAATHGTGCTFSAALAAGLALGWTTVEAARAARRFVAAAIDRGVPLGHGPAPVRQI